MISLKFNGQAKCGSYGAYYKFSKTLGLKVFSTFCHLGSIEREMSYCNVAHSIGIAPKAHGIVRVLLDDEIRFALILDHIDGKILWKHYGVNGWNLADAKAEHICLGFNRRLINLGIYLVDSHGGNVIRTKTGKYFRIDFGPNGVHEVNKHNKATYLEIIERRKWNEKTKH